MTENVEDYALLFKVIEAKKNVSKVEYIKYLFSRVSIVVKDSADDYAKNFISKCEELLNTVGRISHDDVYNLQGVLENYSDDEHLQPPQKAYYFSMPMLIGIGAVEYVVSGDDEIFFHICEQYETMLQVVNYSLNGVGVYSVDKEEVIDKFLHGLDRNTYFEKFSRTINQ